MGVPKKRTSISKKRIRKNIWKKKGDSAALKALSFEKSFKTGKLKSFCMRGKFFTKNPKGFFVRQRKK